MSECAFLYIFAFSGSLLLYWPGLAVFKFNKCPILDKFFIFVETNNGISV